VPVESSRLERANAKEIVNSLGKERTRVARNRDEIEVRVGLARTGRELFPALILAMALVLAAESLLANRFYRGADGTTKTEASRGVFASERGGGPPGSLSTAQPVSVAAGLSKSRA
jgi:hypothetical protein